MRPIELKFSGLHCFEKEQYIDFNLVSNNGFFGIFGETGSGKSTILDAITLALFGKVQRSRLKTDFINSVTNKTQVSLLFSTNDNSKSKIYRVERNIKVKKNGKDIDSSAILYCGNDVMADSVVIVDDTIKQLLGMGINEFTKCIALPQGEFAGFLKAKPAERIDLIGNIFDLSEFGEELWQKTKQRYEKTLNELNIVMGKIEMLGDISDENKKTLLFDKNKTEKELNAVVEDLKKDEQNYKIQTEIKYKADRLKQLEDKASALKEFEKNIQEKKLTLAKYQDVQQKISTIEKSMSLSSELEKISDEKLQLETKIEEQSIAIIDCKKKLQTIEKVCDTVARNDIEVEKLEKLKKVEIELESKKMRQSEIVLQKDEATKKLDDIFQKKTKLLTELDETNEKIKACEKELKESSMLAGSFQSMLESISDAKQRELLQSIENSISEKFDFVKKARIELLRDLTKKQKQMKTWYDKLELKNNELNAIFPESQTAFEKIRKSDKLFFEMQSARTIINFFQDELQKVENENANVKPQIDELSSHITELRLELESIENACNANEHKLKDETEEREQALCASVVAMTASELNVGDKCPICDNEITKHIFKQSSDIKNYDANIQVIKRQQMGLNIEKQIKSTELKVAEQKLEDINDTISRNKSKIKQIKSIINEQYIKFVDINEKTQDSFEALYQSHETSVKALEKLYELEQTAQKNCDKIKDVSIELGAKISLYMDIQNSVSDFIMYVNSLGSELDFKMLQNTDKIDVSDTLKKHEQAQAMVTQKSEELFELQSQSRNFSMQLSTVLVEEISLQNSLKNLDSELDIITKFIEESQAEISASIRNFGSIDSKIASLISAKSVAVENQEKIKNELSLLEQKLVKIQHDYDFKKLQLGEKKSELQACINDLSELYKKYGFKSNQDVLKFCVKEDVIDKLKSELQSFESQKSNNVEERKELMSMFVEVSFAVDVNADLKSIIDEKRDKEAGLRETLGMQSHRINKLNENIKIAKILTSDKNRLQDELDRVVELQNLLKGKGLMEFVAEEYIAEISQIATQKLALLMDSRYSIVFEDKDFLVEDNFDGGKRRSASTLSGGETFIVSLSLALAISESIMLRSDKRSNFFFLDEGFGTLDANLRDTVMNALYRLKNNDMTIGLITHIPELQSEIKNRIYVEKENNGRGSTIRVEQGL